MPITQTAKDVGMTPIRSALGLAMATLLSGATLAIAAPATTFKTYYAAQKGCGSTLGPARLEARVETDDSPGCTPGGVPVNEVLFRLGMGQTTKYASAKLKPFTLDPSQAITGSVAAASPAGKGSGQILWEVTLTATTTGGKILNLGSTTVQALTIFPGASVSVPFTMKVPASTIGQKLTSVTLGVEIHGASAGMTGRKLDGETYVKLPTRLT